MIWWLGFYIASVILGAAAIHMAKPVATHHQERRDHLAVVFLGVSNVLFISSLPTMVYLLYRAFGHG